MAKAGAKAIVKAGIRKFVRETAENAAATVATEALEDAGVSSEAAAVITTVLDPSRAAGKVDEALDAAKGSAKRRAKSTPDPVADTPSNQVAEVADASSTVEQAVEIVSEPQGIIYKRIHPETGEEYIGQAKSSERYEARQSEHNREGGIKYDYEELGRAEPGIELDLLEEDMIRANGGLQKEGGTLANMRHQVNDAKYRQHRGSAAIPLGGEGSSPRGAKRTRHRGRARH